MEEIVLRTAHAMVSEGCPFRGVLFAGLMIKNGKAKLLEHNVRFGDPECQGLMARLDSDLLAALMQVSLKQQLQQVGRCYVCICACKQKLGYVGMPGQ
jgi:phosphoribosylamine-glycine ligase